MNDHSNDVYTMAVPVLIPYKRLAYLLCTAFEGGIGYWACITGYQVPEQVRNYIGGGAADPKYISYPLSPFGAVKIEEVEDDEHKQHILNFAKICDGLTIMQSKYPKHWADFMAENEDAITGDVFVQCCLFGKIVYG